MVDHDRLFKELLTEFLDDFLRLFAPELAKEVVPDSVELMNGELGTDIPQASKRVVDVLARFRFRDTPDATHSWVLVHVENQASPEAGFAGRMFRYFAAIVLKFGDTPVYPIAVFSYPQPARPEPTRHVVRLPGLDVLRFRFRAVQLNRLPWRAFLKRPNPVAAALMSRMRMAPSDRPLVKAACLRMLVGLELDERHQTMIFGFVDTYLRLDQQEQNILREELGSTPDGEKVMEIVTSWMEEGLARGREEGMARGREQEALRLVVAQLRRRMGALPTTLEDRLGALTLPQLEELSEALLDLGSVAALEDWLAAH